MYPHKSEDLPGWWTLDYRPDGVKGKRERVHFESYAAALEAKISLEGPRLRTTHPRLSDIVDEYLQWAMDPAQGNLAASTIENKRYRLERFIIPALGAYRVRDLSQRILDGYTRGKTKSTVLTDLRHLKALIRWMAKRHYAEPLNWEPDLPKYRRQVKRLPNNSEINEFIDAIPIERHRIMCRLMLLSGLRWNEVKHLRWEHYRGGAILLQKSKRDLNEIITIPAPCLEWFETYKKDEGYVFAAAKKKTPPCGIVRVLAETSKKTGVKMTPHMLRHASATALYDITEDIYAVQHHLRHANLATTQIYTRYSEVRRRGNIDLLTEAFNVDKK